MSFLAELKKKQTTTPVTTDDADDRKKNMKTNASLMASLRISDKLTSAHSARNNNNNTNNKEAALETTKKQSINSSSSTSPSLSHSHNHNRGSMVVTDQAAVAQAQFLAAKKKKEETKKEQASSTGTTTSNLQTKTTSFLEAPFEYNPNSESDGKEEEDDDYDAINDTKNQFFSFVSTKESSDDFIPRIVDVETTTCIEIPFAPLMYRTCDYTFEKAVRSQQTITLTECVRKLGILRALHQEHQHFNLLLGSRRDNPIDDEEVYSKTRFMELISNYGSGVLARQVIDLLLKETTKAADRYQKVKSTGVVWVTIPGLKKLLHIVEETCRLQFETARHEIQQLESVSFYPGLGELFCPGSRLITYPDGMEGNPLGVTCIQSWYTDDTNYATGKTKQRFVLVIEFIVSVGDELVFVAMTDVYPEFHDLSRNVPLKDLKHRKLHITPTTLDMNNQEASTTRTNQDQLLFQKLQQRGEFYASVATKNHFLEYYSDSFFPILKGGSGWSSNAVRPLSKGGRVMVDVKRGIIEGHIPIRSSASGTSGDATSDTVKEAIKLFESSKKTGIAVPFRTCILPDKFRNSNNKTTRTTTTERNNISPSTVSIAEGADDRARLWMSWPMLVGFSFTARVWGKLLLGMPKVLQNNKPSSSSVPSSSVPSSLPSSPTVSPSRRRGMGSSSLTAQQRPSSRKFGFVDIAALGGEGSCGNCGYIRFQTQAFDQLVLAEDKKELIRAVARNSGGSGGGGLDEDSENNASESDDEDDDDDFEDVGIDVVANKGGASIFLLHGPPGCGKTLTAEAIAELLEKPLYIVTAGDLGISASEVEKNLGSVLELCQTWDALVLIDEADVFLEARSSTEIERNALVCVMLRLLEYYSGCLFLSSNRSASSIDAAIASRITVMLGYPQLDSNGRAKIWKNLIELVPSVPIDPLTGEPSVRILSKPRKASKYRVDFSLEEYRILADSFELNGRQIKNSIVLARALARERRTPLTMTVLNRAVIAVAGEDAVAS
mmetsp:Transcript_47093/g.53493  ORF Transcript_47093/g.53493 Transcript_47093/m.53493 type:complete len:1005 (-) Transcript_47093:204-3218(-)